MGLYFNGLLTDLGVKGRIGLGRIIISINCEKSGKFTTFFIFLNDIIIYISVLTQQALKYNKKSFMNFLKTGQSESDLNGF